MKYQGQNLPSDYKDLGFIRGMLLLSLLVTRLLGHLHHKALALVSHNDHRDQYITYLLPLFDPLYYNVGYSLQLAHVLHRYWGANDQHQLQRSIVHLLYSRCQQVPILRFTMTGY